MSCVQLEHLAAAASDEAGDDAAKALVHAASCERCAALLAEQRSLRSLVRGAATRPIDRDRRAALAARLASAQIPAAAVDECLSYEALAEAAIADADPAHAMSCDRCAALLADQREVRELARHARWRDNASAGDPDSREQRDAGSSSAQSDGAKLRDPGGEQRGPSSAQSDVARLRDPGGEQRGAGSSSAQSDVAKLRDPGGEQRGAGSSSAQSDVARLRDPGGEQRGVGSSSSLWPTLDPARRDELAAEIMAQADALPRKRRRLQLLVAGAAVAAAAIGIVIATRSPTPGEPIALDPVPLEIPRIRPSVVPIDDAPTPDASPQLARVTASKGAQLSRETTQAGDIVRLRDGGVTVDAERSNAVVVSGATRVEVSHARAAIIVRRGVVETVQVFAGVVELTTNGKRQTVRAGTIWRADLGGAGSDVEPVHTARGSGAAGSGSTSPVDPKPEPAAEVSLRAFREGWAALRANQHRDAIAAFDRATDPVVAEDAAYWAAIAAERAGDRADASRRFTDFIARFPASPRIDTAREATRRLAP